MDKADAGPSRGRLPLRTLLSYGSSMIGLNGMLTMVGVHLLFFCTEVARIGPRVVSLVMALAQVWDAITDPLMGHLSDRTSWKWGRRRPYILLGSLPTAVLFFCVFSPPTSLSAGGVSLFFAASLLLFYACRTVWDTPYCSLAPELTLDYDERIRVSGYQQVFGTVGDVVGTLAPVILVGMFATQRTGWSVVGALVAAVALASAISTYVGTRENPRLGKASQLSLIESLRATFRNRPYRFLVLTSTLTGMSNYTTIAVVRYVIKYWFRAPELEMYFFGAFFVGVFLSIPLWVRITRRVGKKAAYIGTMLVYSVILWGIMVLGRGDHLLFGVLMLLAGAFNIGLWLIPGSIVPDIIEWDQLQVGERREGAYYGIWTLIRKAAIGGAYIIIGLVLDGIGFEPGAAEQAAPALLGMRALLGPVPSVLLIIGLVIFLKFPITKRVHQDILRQLAEREE
jgi:GPH family glycoside/pentoside/hexuronide:cation symporter